MFIVIEAQTNDTTATIVNTYADRNQAEQKYHEILSFASVSDIKIHSAIMITAEGYYIKSEHYEHNIEE